MRIGVVGAGAVGGYFGARFVEKGEDVTFLVRPNRKAQLDQSGLVVHSQYGDAKIPVKTQTADQQAKPFDLVLLSVKAYHLMEAVNDLKPFCKSNTIILPLLNGYSHIKYLQKEFGDSAVLGGYCFIESTLNDHGEIVHMGEKHRLVYGELSEQRTKRIDQIDKLFENKGFTAISSRQIRTDMWNKYQYVSALSGMTALMRSNLGEILQSAYGGEIYFRLLTEINAIAVHQQLSVTPETPEEIFKKVQTGNPKSTSSMFRDLDNGLPIESEHLHGSLVEMGERLGLDVPVLKTVANTLSLYRPRKR